MKDARKTSKAWLISAEKENRPLKNAKRKYSFAGLFEDVRNKRWRGRDYDEGDIPPAFAGRGASRGAEGLFAQFTSRANNGQHAVYRGFDETVDAYEQGVDASIKTLLQPVCDELEARVKGLDAHGRPISRPGVLSDADLERLEAEGRALSKPLGEEEMDVEIPQPDGSKVLKRITFSSVLEAYSKLCVRKEAELQTLEQELGELNAEMTAAYNSVSDETSTDLVLAKERLHADMAKFKQASQAAKDQLAAEFEEARAEDKAASAATNKKIQEFMKALQ